MTQSWRRRLRYWMHSGERARLLSEEMEFHLEMKAQELMDSGMAEMAARNEARRRFGNLARRQEESRETWIARWMNDLVLDAAFALRTVRSQPGFAVIAVLSAALGIGACSLIFGIANFALFRPLPVGDPSRLESITARNLIRGKSGQTLSFPDVEDLRRARSFQGIAAFFQPLPVTISTDGDPQRYWGSLVTADYFDIVRPDFVVGRGFEAGRDDRKGEAPVAVLSHRLWQSRFGGDRTIVGRSIDLNNQKVTVLGITAPGFRGTELVFYSDFWLPFSMSGSLAGPAIDDKRLQDRGGQWLSAVGRLRDGVNQAAAASEVETIGGHLRDAYPATNKNRGFHIERAGQINPGLRKLIVLFFLLLLGTAVLVLCTACANVANLLLARASARRKEIAVRLALGASRGRLIRQLLTESVMLALLGGVGGYGIAQLGASAFGRSRIPLSLPVDFSVSLDYRVMLFCAALSALTGVLFGLVPALRTTRPDLVDMLKDERVKIGRLRHLELRDVLVVAQLTICTVLLVCSGLFLRSLYAAHNMETGIAHRNLLMLAFDPSLNRYSPDETRRIVDAILERTGALPGVESVSLGSSVPLSMEGTQNTFVPEAADPGGEGKGILADIYSIAPRFFESFGIRRIEGEDFRPGVPTEDIVIVNQALADKAFPDRSPVGRHIRYHGRRVRIIGLVATAKSRTIGEDPHPCLYFPIAKDIRGNDSLTGITLVLRTHGNPEAHTSQVRQTIRDIDPTLALFDVRTMETHLSQALFLPRATAGLFGLAGLTGLLISMVGIYGVVSFTVVTRTREIGIRVALGARRGQVLALVLKKGLVLTVAGAAIGLGLALALSRVMASLLYGVRPTDALTFLGTPAFLLLVTAAACLVPARRAASLDSNRALRYE